MKRVTLSLLVVAFTAWAPISVLAEQSARTQDENLRKIFTRQKGDQLKVYLKDGRAMYINGVQISSKTLAQVVKKSGLKEGVLSFSLEVQPTRVKEVQQLLKDAGLNKVELGSPLLSLEKAAHAAREEAARRQKETLLTLVSRQKDDQLGVYLRPASMHVNGRQISTSILAAFVRQAKLKQGIITAREDVPAERIKSTMELLQKLGVKKVAVAAAK